MQRTQTRVPDGKKKNKLPLWNGTKIFINIRFKFGKVICFWKNLWREIIPKDRGRRDERFRETFNNSTLAEGNCILVCLRGLSGSSGSIKWRWNATLQLHWAPAEIVTVIDSEATSRRRDWEGRESVSVEEIRRKALDYTLSNKSTPGYLPHMWQQYSMHGWIVPT